MVPLMLSGLAAHRMIDPNSGTLGDGSASVI